MNFFWNTLFYLILSNKPCNFIQPERKYMKFTVRLNHKMSIACRSCRSCQQTNQIFPSNTQRISTKLHMYHHMDLLSLLMVSVYILYLLILYKMYWKSHKWSCHSCFSTVWHFFKFCSWMHLEMSICIVFIVFYFTFSLTNMARI